MKRKSGRGRGRPARGHIKVQFNIRPEISRMIEQGAAREEITRSQYIENLVEAAFRLVEASLSQSVNRGFARKILKSGGA